ncbi:MULTISPECIES: peroxiredoxin-like family protein [Pseudoalteromonas]|jgi:peroxiredoxin|uniref:AhpC/TSA family protein n=1 Tax=Pseudoalteromonas agarivorans TaxID=176102 RepID=A0AAD0XBA3_9GAMM|nr:MULTISPECIES: peroxiredoxin-like family protein [Pseudoalteromonas]AYM86126.1 AhpC/TSA family protein [Pseudoalteromonas agarivorans]KYL31785.1 thioredoxin peroxidase [Pseudoalteromonas telluritireducens]MCK8132348.1 AhpC/TSA family protein [Pseudoalteromonas sp. 2CM28B]MCQ8885281.1 AhpC/TSA family protein [Pseudoalteromonas agarivorans]MDC9525155.1 peroxiredoxin-like family protein [Pseudoalteromonas sp. Angola-30]|tara:strand:+ start:27 stop:557 length:531 start_codon:yes stop_codon:yes gene_type:complete
MSNVNLQPASVMQPLVVSDLDNNDVNLVDRVSDKPWKMIVVYRGQHCPKCTEQLNELATMHDDFASAGVEVVAVSGDSEEQLKKHLEKIDVNFPLYYNLTIEQMTDLGLYISEPRSDAETDHPFAEPCIIVLNEDNQVQMLDKSNSPFVRPSLKQLLGGIKFSRENDYPIRGTFIK